jgi:hypothetical protein
MKKLFLFFSLLVVLSAGAQTYNPAAHTVTNKALGVAQAVPTDARSFFYDASLFIYRPYQSTSEVLTYLNLSKFRVGNFSIFINVGGTLQSGGTFVGGSITEYWFKDGTTNSDLVVKTLGQGTSTLVKYTDTSSMLAAYFKSNDTTGRWQQAGSYLHPTDVIPNQQVRNLDSAASLRLPANQYRMLNLFSKVFSHSVIKWLTWGDSYAQKIYAQIVEYLKNEYGGTSGAYNSGAFGITTNSTTGTITDQLAAFDIWPSGLATSFSSGSSRTYGVGGGAVTCEKINVFYAKESSGGTFKVQVDGVDATGFTNVSATGTKGSLGIANIIVPKGSHTATIVGLTGNVRVVSIGMEDTTTSGLISISVAQGGIPMDSAVAYPTGMANFNQFLAFVQPTVFMHEMKEASITYAGNLNTFYSTISANVANTDMIMVASPPVASNDFDQVIQNEQLRQHAKSFGYNFFDRYTIYKNYAAENAAGMSGDGVHVSQSADQYAGSLFLRDFGILGMIGTNQPYNVLSSTVGVIDTLRLLARSGTKAPFTMVSAGSGQDVNITLNRNYDIYDSSKTLLLSRVVGSGAQNPVIQNSSQIGSGNVRLVGASTYASFIYPTTGVSAHLLVASVINNGLAQTISSGGITCNLLNAGLQEITLTGNANSFAFSNGLGSGQFIYLRIAQDAVGGRTITGWNSSIHFQNETPPILSTAPNSSDFFVFEQKSGSYYEVSRSIFLPRLTTAQRDAALTLGQLQGALTVTSGGTGYTPGTYTLVPVVSAFGTLALATVVVNGAGNISSISTTSSGSGYRAGQTVSVSQAAVGGTGSGFIGTIDFLNISGSGTQIFNIDQVRTNLYNATLGSWVTSMADGLTTKVYAATTNVDFNNTRMQTVSLTGDITFTTSNIRPGSESEIRVICDASSRNFVFPAGWTFVSNAPPASISPNKTGILHLRSFGSNDANIVATWAVQP